MIRFFREVKQRLLSENKVGSYLSYAIGEIILVVLGILIAIQVNNRNTNQQERKIESSYLVSIQNNLQEDIEELQVRLGKDSTHLNASTQLIRAFRVDSIRTNEVALKKAIHNSSTISYFNPQNTAFEDMKSTGNLDLIESESLRNRILEYYNYSQRVVASQAINNELFLQYKDQSVAAHLDMNSLIEPQIPEQWREEVSPFNTDFFERDISSPEVEDFARYLSLMKASVWINHNWKQDLLEQAQKVREEIKQYLQER
ncbi:MAG: DUF6090 family protein [Bacteroidota bacterium]